MTRRFSIPLDNQRPLFGAFLAAHAIPDAVDIMHTGVGCKPKAQRQIARHDRSREAQNKMVWSDVDESLLITGSLHRLREMTIETYGRREGVGLLLLTTSTSMEMTSLDVQSVLPDIRGRVGCPVIYLPTPGYSGDLHEGYQRVVRAVMGLCDWSTPPRQRLSVNIVGYLFDRYEHDHAMSLHELRRLLAGLGVQVVTTYLSGTPMAGLMTGPRAEANVVLPWARSISDEIASSTGRPTVRVDLPLGVANTTRFLENVAAALHAPPDRLLPFVSSETDRLAPLLRIAREALSGARVGILADTPTAAGLLGLCADLGMLPVLVGLLDRTLGGKAELEESLRRAAVVRDPDCVVLEDPCASDVAEAFASAPGGAAPEILVAPDVWLPEPVTSRVARVELGIPSNGKHAIYAQPVLGYRGAISLAQRLMDARARVH